MLAAVINAEQLQEYFIDNIQHEESVKWNESAQRIEAKQTTLLARRSIHNLKGAHKKGVE